MIEGLRSPKSGERRKALEVIERLAGDEALGDQAAIAAEAVCDLVMGLTAKKPMNLVELEAALGAMRGLAFAMTPAQIVPVVSALLTQQLGGEMTGRVLRVVWLEPPLLAACLPLVLELTRHPEPKVRWTVPAVLGRASSAHPEAMQALRKALRDSDAVVRKEAKIALEALERTASVPERVRKEAAKALGR